jgi:hypothetical protein
VQTWDASKVHNLHAVALDSMFFALSGIRVHIKREAATENARHPHNIFDTNLGSEGRLNYRHSHFPVPTASQTPLIADADYSVNRLPRSILIMYRYATSDGISDDAQMPCVVEDGWGCRVVPVFPS